MPARDESLDAVKYILIVSVIFGHCLGHSCDYSLNQGVYNFVNIYHMPLFIFLSGYFSKKYNLKIKEERNHFLVSQLKLLETFIVFNCVHQLLVIHSINVFLMFKSPSWSLWYLLSLFLWRTIVQLLPNKIVCSTGMIPVFFLFGLAVGLVPIDGFMSFQRTCTYLGFFMSGFILSKKNFVSMIRSVPRCVPAMVLGLVLFCCLFFFAFDMHKIIWGYYSYQQSGLDWTAALMFRFCFFVTAILLGLSILSLIRKKVNVLSLYGKKTLFFYVYHTLLLYGVFALVRKLELPMELPFVILYTLVVVALLHIGTRIKFLSFVINPVSGVVQKVVAKKK